jgi:hypothetical protein
MNSSKPLISFWLGLVLAVVFMAPIVVTLPAFGSNMNSGGILSLVFLPASVFSLALLAVSIFALFGMYRRNRRALVSYMVIAPIGLIFSLSVLSQIIFPKHIVVGNTPTYSSTSSLAVTAMIAGFLFAIAVVEFLATKDLRTLGGQIRGEHE